MQLYFFFEYIFLVFNNMFVIKEPMPQFLNLLVTMELDFHACVLIGFMSFDIFLLLFLCNTLI